MSEEEIDRRPEARPVFSSEPEAHAYTDGASTGSRGPGGFGVVVTWNGKTEEVSGGEPDTTNQRMEVTAACIALETIDEGYVVTIYSDSSYLINCMRRGWHETWRDNGWMNNLKEPVANRDLWERLLRATRRHREVRWKKVKGHQKNGGPHKAGNDRADELAVSAKKKADGDRRSDPMPPKRAQGYPTRP
ncbi:ribonuclease HI [soil metagenome]